MNKQPSWMSKVTGLKIKKEQLLMILFVGLLLVVIAMPTSKEKKIKTKKSNTPTEYSNYEDATEKRLATALEKVQGVGAVEVMVTLKTSAERIVEKDEEKDENTRKENTIYDSTGSGIQTPYVNKEISPCVEGVMVIAQGGNNAIVVKNITEAVQALFDIDTHKIKIMKMESRKQED